MAWGIKGRTYDLTIGHLTNESSAFFLEMSVSVLLVLVVLS